MENSKRLWAVQLPAVILSHWILHRRAVIATSSPIASSSPVAAISLFAVAELVSESLKEPSETSLDLLNGGSVVGHATSQGKLQLNHCQLNPFDAGT